MICTSKVSRLADGRHRQVPLEEGRPVDHRRRARQRHGELVGLAGVLRQIADRLSVHYAFAMIIGLTLFLGWLIWFR